MGRAILAFVVVVAAVIAALVIFHPQDRPAASSPQAAKTQPGDPAEETAFVQAVIKGGTLATAAERLKLIDKGLSSWRVADWTGNIVQYGPNALQIRLAPGITLIMRQPPAENRAQLLDISQSAKWRIDQRVRFSGEFVAGDNGFAKEAVAPGEIPVQPQFFFRFSRAEPLN